jgi:hypothetical protein
LASDSLRPNTKLNRAKVGLWGGEVNVKRSRSRNRSGDFRLYFFIGCFFKLIHRISMFGIMKHNTKAAKLCPSEVGILASLYALGGYGQPVFWPRLRRDYHPLFSSLPYRTRLFPFCMFDSVSAIVIPKHMATESARWTAHSDTITVLGERG